MKNKIYIFAVLIFIGGIAAGYGLETLFPDESSLDGSGKSYQVRQNGGEYQYINPLLECEMAEGTIDAHKENFREKLATFIENQQQKKQLTKAAVYFRDLNNGPAFGINEAEDFFPASLLKVPVMMVYYHLAEENPSLLQTEILYEKPVELGYTPTIIPTKELVPGQTYTVEDLIRRMIIYSDNQALVLLTSRLPREPLEELFSMLGVGSDVLDDPNAKLTVKEYAGFFRILFNSSYLSHEHSEKTLTLLASTDFDEGIVAGLPKNIPVAHKFGEAGTMDAERQLHDCGVVYLSQRPYLACIMTRGQKPEMLKSALKDISRFIYEEVQSQQ